MKIDGKKAVISANQNKVFQFLSDFNNYEKLMPEQIVNWQSDKDTCSFSIKGMADLKLKICPERGIEAAGVSSRRKDSGEIFAANQPGTR